MYKHKSSSFSLVVNGNIYVGLCYLYPVMHALILGPLPVIPTDL